jgi:single-strand DNA-binding protein
MELELKGTIKVINDAQVYDSGFQKREFVITTDEKFPQDVKMEFVKEKCSLLDSYALGQPVTVGFNVRGNEYNGKYYVNLQAWKISGDGLPKSDEAF